MSHLRAPYNNWCTCAQWYHINAYLTHIPRYKVNQVGQPHLDREYGMQRANQELIANLTNLRIKD